MVHMLLDSLNKRYEILSMPRLETQCLIIDTRDQSEENYYNFKVSCHNMNGETTRFLILPIRDT